MAGPFLGVPSGGGSTGPTGPTGPTGIGTSGGPTGLLGGVGGGGGGGAASALNPEALAQIMQILSLRERLQNVGGDPPVPNFGGDPRQATEPQLSGVSGQKLFPGFSAQNVTQLPTLSPVASDQERAAISGILGLQGALERKRETEKEEARQQAILDAIEAIGGR